MDIKVSEFPTEMLQYIYKFLPTLKIIKCREVCVWWKETIDGMLCSDDAWLKLCRRDFPKQYKDARLKSRPDLSWQELYKSLHIWSKLAHSKETWFELANAKRDEDHIVTIHAWDGTAAAHRDQALVYYNLETLEPACILDIGKFKMFQENEYVMAYMLYTNIRMLWIRNLKIVPKLNGLPIFEKEVEIENVNNFLIAEQKVYYNKWQKKINQGNFIEIYVCNVNDDLKCSLLNRVKNAVWVFGYKDELLNFITVNSAIYTLSDEQFVMSDRVTDEDCFYKLCKNNLVEQANFYGWIMDATSITSRSSYLEGLTVRLWGDIAVVGNEKGILKIYHRHVLCNNFHAEPIRIYDLKNIFKLTNAEINGIDFVPIKHGHLVLISTPCKIMVLSLQAKCK